MNTIRNCYFFGRIVVWCRAGAIPSVTVASSTLHVDELACRTSPESQEWISRHYREEVNLETFRVSREMLDRIRLVFTRIQATCAGDNEHIEKNSGSSNWLFQPKDDGWCAMYNGRLKDIHAFRGWLAEILT